MVLNGNDMLVGIRVMSEEEGGSVCYADCLRVLLWTGRGSQQVFLQVRFRCGAEGRL